LIGAGARRKDDGARVQKDFEEPLGERATVDPDRGRNGENNDLFASEGVVS